MNDVFKSKEFWVGIVGAVATLALYFVGKYAAAGLEDLQVVINVLLPIILVLIGAYTVETVAKVNAAANVEIAQAQLQMVQYQVRLQMREQYPMQTRAQTQED